MTETHEDPLTAIYRRAEIYEAVYRGRGKDYEAEAAEITALVRERRPDASSLLDVACGPGTHLGHLSGSFERVEGVDLAEDMVRLAAANLPGTPVHQGDMRSFDLGRRFDAVICMFSSIAHLSEAAEVEATLARLAAHTEPGGVIVLEPWYFPERATERHVSSALVTVEGRTIARVSHSLYRDGAHHMDVHYTVASPEEGVEHFIDVHVLAVHRREVYEKAFAAAGCSVEYIPGPGPGLFVGVAGGPA
ncbi:class I SAM-dependent methyltransferase [Nocardiopsis lambiniae]|uniref:Class I SAM-dependent methyltransferase n=1 Tax=Nocardiopsis lambiniae TaxID=3075539 RepID=A0ABU2MAB6_9ACTN|nr:class I SAM-dependent methyltransferase [Nocardiopsis sp. DSM 44743]MDT0329530.1 class I SAM-dependent methyltransferase [Nocardiopsis sp. DSM 44743]